MPSVASARSGVAVAALILSRMRDVWHCIVTGYHRGMSSQAGSSSRPSH
jgi:hypothetical protein